MEALARDRCRSIISKIFYNNNIDGNSRKFMTANSSGRVYSKWHLKTSNFYMTVDKWQGDQIQFTKELVTITLII